MKMYGRRRQISSEETAANAAAKAAREIATMTCQCCAKKYLANTGLMAHHGYERPGGGWQTSSCFGARHLPFEVSRDTLGDMIVSLKIQRDRLIVLRQEASDEKHPLKISYEDYAQPKVWDALRRRNAYPTVDVEFTRATFAAQMDAHKVGLTRYGRQVGSFDERKASDLAARDSQIKRVNTDIHDSQKRFDGWTQTLAWDATRKLWKLHGISDQLLESADD